MFDLTNRIKWHHTFLCIVHPVASTQNYFYEIQHSSATAATSSWTCILFFHWSHFWHENQIFTSSKAICHVKSIRTQWQQLSGCKRRGATHCCSCTDSFLTYFIFFPCVCQCMPLVFYHELFSFITFWDLFAKRVNRCIHPSLCFHKSSPRVDPSTSHRLK